MKISPHISHFSICNILKGENTCYHIFLQNNRVIYFSYEFPELGEFAFTESSVIRINQYCCSLFSIYTCFQQQTFMITLVHCLTKRIPSHSSTHSNLILVHNTHAAKYCGLFSVPLLSFQHYLINLTTPSSEQFSSLGSGDNKPSIFLIFISYFF